MTVPHADRSPRRAALAFIFVTVVLDMLALGIIIPVLPKLVVDFAGGDIRHGSQVFGLFGSVWAVMQFLAAPLLGAVSDRFGRRRVILASNVGMGLDYILMALAPSLGWLFAGRVISGITAASIPTAYAYIADVTPPEKRAPAFGMIGAAFGIGFILGPALGGLLGGFGPRTPFWVAAVLGLANAAYGFFVLPESLPPANRGPIVWARANPVGSLGFLRAKPQLLGFGLVHFLYTLQHAVLPSVFVLYAGYRYAWDQRTIGLSLAAVGVASMIMQGGLIGPIVSRIGERRALLLGIGCSIVAMVIFGLAPTGLLFAIGVPLSAFGGLYGASSQGMMTRRVGPSEQGMLQGALSSLQGIAEVLGPAIFTFTFALFVRESRGWSIPGAPFLLAAVFLAAALGVAWRIAHPLPETT